ncbi:MAG TPA: apolipoprotein N-acyltransferase [Mesorhizobium sp.]|jgi:apolipoprotein N-acyltransferase|nr:apolipoprotein N-acyltransferase [Mesorhizobium sp.]
MERLAGRVILLWGWRRALLAFAAGAFAVLAHPPFDFFAAPFLSFPILAWLLDGAVFRAPAPLWRRLTPFLAVGWWWGFGYFLAGLWWVGSALLVEAEQFAWALPFAVLGLPMVMAVFFGLGAAFARPFWSDGLGRIAALAFGFGLAEWLRGWALTGFPWNPIGFAAMPVPLLMQSVGVVGTTGMNVLSVFVYAAPALLGTRRGAVAGLSLALLLGAAHLGYGWWRLQAPLGEATGTLSVRIVQPNIDLTEKWEGPAQERIFATTMALSKPPPSDAQAPPALVLWPETSVPFLFNERPDALQAIGEMLGPDQLLLAGAVRAESDPSGGDARYYNALVAVSGEGVIADAVDKVHLVPFGEYLPFSGLFARWGVDTLVAGPMNFAAGPARRLLMLPGGVVAAPFICYEIIFPDLVMEAAAGADVIVNVTNDAWFGDTAGPYQHLRQAQIRAVETGRPVLRAANNGISAIIDARGRIADALALNARGAIDGRVPLHARADRFFLAPEEVGILILCFFFAGGSISLLRRKVRVN